MQEFIIQPPTNEEGVKTLSFSLAEYIAFSAIEDFDYIHYDRVAVVEFPYLDPMPVDPQFNSRPFFYAVSQKYDHDLVIDLWLHLQSWDFVIAQGRKAHPVCFLYTQETHPSMPLPSREQIRVLFDELLAHPDRLFPLHDQPSHWKEPSEL